MNNTEEMRARSPKLATWRCAYCSEPLPFDSAGVNAWREGNQFFCNEFCAASTQDEARPIEQRKAPTRS
jgi:hypothetical protein